MVYAPNQSTCYAYLWYHCTVLVYISTACVILLFNLSATILKCMYTTASQKNNMAIDRLGTYFLECLFLTRQTMEKTKIERRRASNTAATSPPINEGSRAIEGEV